MTQAISYLIVRGLRTPATKRVCQSNTAWCETRVTIQVSLDVAFNVNVVRAFATKYSNFRSYQAFDTDINSVAIERVMFSVRSKPQFSAIVSDGTLVHR